MYHIGEGGTSLKNMDTHIKRRQGNILNMFSSKIINDDTLSKMKRKKVRVNSSTMSMSKASHSTHADTNVYGVTGNMGNIITPGPSAMVTMTSAD